MRGSTKKPVVHTKRYSLRLKTKKPKESDRDVRDRLEKEAGDAWDEYDKHMREDLVDEGIMGILGSRAASNIRRSSHRSLQSKEREARRLGYKNVEEWDDARSKEAADKWEKQRTKNARDVKRAKKAGTHSGRLTHNKSGTVLSMGKAEINRRNEKVKGMFKEGKDVTLSGRNSIEADTSKKQETWKMNKELKNAIAKAIKASRAQIISTYSKPIHPGKVNSQLHEKHSKNQLRQALQYHSDAMDDLYDQSDNESERKARRSSQAYRVAQKMLDKKMYPRAKKWTELSDESVYKRLKGPGKARHSLKMAIKKSKRAKR